MCPNAIRSAVVRPAVTTWRTTQAQLPGHPEPPPGRRACPERRSAGAQQPHSHQHLQRLRNTEGLAAAALRLPAARRWLMHVLGLQSVRRGLKTRTIIHTMATKSPLTCWGRDFTALRRKVRWVADITYMATGPRSACAAFIDLGSRADRRLVRCRQQTAPARPSRPRRRHVERWPGTPTEPGLAQPSDAGHARSRVSHHPPP